MCEATGGKVQKEKVIMCSQKWENNNIVEVPINIKINKERVKIIEARTSMKKLGVCISPSLSWREFKYVKQKMKVSVKKLTRADMNLH